MGKQRKWTLEEKEKIVKECRNGATISYLMKKYDIPSWETVSTWNKKYGSGTLGNDNSGRKNKKLRILIY